jgi:hypothetical protein
MRTVPSELQWRRQEALERYLAGDPIAVICREMGCAKSWLYKWKKRYQFADPAWLQEHSRRPGTTPTKTPDALEAEIVRLRQAVSPDGSGPVSADMIRDYLRQHGGAALPSRRTIYRILNRQAQEVNSHRKTEKKR